MAGLLTDSLTPRTVFPLATASISILSFVLMLCFELSMVADTLANAFSFIVLLLILVGGWVAFGSRRVKKVIWWGKAILKLTSRFKWTRLAIIGLMLLGAGLIIKLIATTTSFVVHSMFSIDIKLVLIFLRGICIAVAMNAAYVTVGDLYKGDPFLPAASNYLYIGLFGALAFVPLLIEQVPKKPAFVIFATIIGLLSFLLRRNVPKTSSTSVDLIKYFKSWPLLIRQPEFLLSCAVSMICIGGFYNIIYIFTDAGLKGDYSGNISVLQSIGRQCTFGILTLIYLFNISFLKTSNKNCAQYMAFAMGTVSVSVLILTLLHLGIPSIKLGLLAQIMFWLTCCCTGFAQPAAKLSVISIAQKIGPNITGSAQSFVTLFNSVIEQQGAKIILAYTYPTGARLYLVGLSVFCGFLGLGIFTMRRKINSYIGAKSQQKTETAI